MTKRRNVMLRWVEEYLAATPARPLSAEERCTLLEAEIAELERRVKALGESVARAHSYGDAT